MKKINLSVKSGVVLALVLLVSSCSLDQQVVEDVANSKLAEEEVSAIPDSENLRKGRTFRYQERFSNQITPTVLPNEDPQFPVEELTFLPGVGEGNATFLGRAKSFINQVAIGESTSIGAPVTMFYGEQLAELGLTDISDEVSSVTVDRRGNAIFFKNIINTATPVSETLVRFVAEVQIVGGAGRFEGASGEAIVEGSFNPLNGQGSTIVKGFLSF
jgi:hypothetical protein